MVCHGGEEFKIDPAATALLVVDMQRDFVGEVSAFDGGELLRVAIPNVRALTAAARAARLTVIHTRAGYGADLGDVTPVKAAAGYVGKDGPNGPVLIRGSYGHDFIDECAPRKTEPVIDKAAFSAFFQTDLDQHLQARSVTSLILAGVTTECCVHSTLRDAVDRGFHCVTIEDACAAMQPELHDAALVIIRASDGAFGQTTTTGRMVRGLAELSCN